MRPKSCIEYKNLIKSNVNIVKALNIETKRLVFLCISRPFVLDSELPF